MGRRPFWCAAAPAVTRWAAVRRSPTAAPRNLQLRNDTAASFGFDVTADAALTIDVDRVAANTGNRIDIDDLTANANVTCTSSNSYYLGITGTLSNSAIIYAQDSGCSVQVIGPYTGTGTLRSAAPTASAAFATGHSGVHFVNGQTNTVNIIARDGGGSGGVAVENSGTIVQLSSQWLRTAGASNADNYVVVRNGGRFEFLSTCAVNVTASNKWVFYFYGDSATGSAVAFADGFDDFSDHKRRNRGLIRAAHPRHHLRK